MNQRSKWLVALLLLAVLAFWAAPALAEESKGTIKDLVTEREEFVLADNDGKDHVFQIAPDAKILLNDEEAAFSDLKEGDTANVTWEDQDGKMLASKIDCKRE